ncbi:MAG: fibronectin type III domain-containing protein [Candidatus Delongbacteria bacterium]|nr:fibronectin type III domain-containing protein [Candidatus Delongbacteria bacterium]
MVPLPRFQLSLLLILLLTWSVQAGSPLRVGMLTDQPKAVLEQPQIMDGKVYDPPARTRFERHASGAPDGHGYIFRDSDELNGPLYNWVDIQGSGTTLNLADDGYSAPLSLPWTFTWYGLEHNSVYICSNGYLMFGGGSNDYGNDPLPATTPPNNLIALFWDDLNPAAGGSVYYGTSGDNWVCQFQAVEEYGGSGRLTAEIILRQDGTVLLQYAALENGLDIDGESIGTENWDGGDGLGISFDADPASYPHPQLAILIEQLAPDATVSGQVTDSESGNPVVGARVAFGSIVSTTDDQGNYLLDEIWSGDYLLRISCDYYLNHNEEITLQPGSNSWSGSLVPSPFPSGLVGYWTFDDPENLLEATLGNNLELSGSHTAIEGPTPEDGAINIGPGSFYRCYHDIPANGYGNPAWVNRFTIVMDVRIPSLGQYYCLYQTNWSNSNDGDWFINPGGQVGISDTGYSQYILNPGEWYRLAISVNLGEHYDYYLDGQLLQIGGAQIFDGRFSLYPAEGVNQVLFFADENGEDNALDVAQVVLFDRDLTATDLAVVGGYGHQFEGPEQPWMNSYLQTPTPTSIYISWHSNTTTESLVQYGLTTELGSNTSGDCHQFDGSTWWHTVQLTGLQPETEYFYRCITGADSSELRSFHTQPADDDFSGIIRFLVYGDTRTDFTAHRMVIDAMQEKIVELYGEDIHNQINLLFNVGDIVSTGSVLSQYVTEHFNPIIPLAGTIPYMISIGNHEGEASHYYNYMKDEDIGGPEGERYYSFRIGPVLFISLNSNTQGDTQLSWLEQQVEAAEADQAINMVFTFLHHPGHSEVWPDGNTGWVQDQLLPLLVQYSKVELLSYGHSHNYERGAMWEGNLRILLSGGGGSALDRWRMYDNQTDYAELHRSFDHYCYSLFEIDCASDSYTARTYSLGHTDLPLDNELVDSWHHYRQGWAVPPTPSALAPTDQGDPQPRLVASPYSGDDEIMSSHFQLTTMPGNYETPLAEARRDWENIYYDSGAPLYEPVDLNDCIDLERFTLPGDLLQAGQTCWWRVRYRDQNLQWSDWSEEAQFTVSELPDTPEFTADVTTGPGPLPVRFTDLSTGDPLSWSWDLDGDLLADSDQQDPTWIYHEPGGYSVSLTVEYATENLTETKTDFITVTGPPPILGELEISISAQQLHLTWQGDPGFSSYRVYVATSPGGPWLFLAETTETYYLSLLPSANRFYQVTGIWDVLNQDSLNRPL